MPPSRSGEGFFTEAHWGKGSYGPSPSVVFVRLVGIRVDGVEARLPYLALAYSPYFIALLLSAFPIAYSLIGMQRIRLVSKTYAF